MKGKTDKLKIQALNRMGFSIDKDLSRDKKEEKQEQEKAFVNSKRIQNIVKKGKEAELMKEDSEVIYSKKTKEQKSEGEDEELVESYNMEENNKLILNHLDIKINQKFDSFRNEMKGELGHINEALNEYNKKNIENFAQIDGKLDELVSYNF